MPAALAALEQVAVVEITVNQYCVNGLRPLTVAVVAPVGVTIALPTRKPAVSAALE